MSGVDDRLLAAALRPAPDARLTEDSFDAWRAEVRRHAIGAVTEFVTDRCASDLRLTGVDITVDVLADFVGDGKCLRSTFAYLGWLAGAGPDDAALRAAASFDLLHIFALLQDDVMDDSPLRRGRPSAHVRFAEWHRRNGLNGSAERFGASAAVLLGDLCLVWAGQMMRESGLGAAALGRAWPRYDAMRTELAVGQFADLVNDAGGRPTLEDVLDVARRKSGNYTVRRPLEIGGALAGCPEPTLRLLGRYGAAVGEAFQLRDDLLGIFGAPTVTGKPTGGDLSEHKATSVVMAAHRLAEPAVRNQLTELMSRRDLSAGDLARWRNLIAATGAVQWIEQLIDRRLSHAMERLHTSPLDDAVRTALVNMAAVCTQRAA
ncbi:polyprenyl synthetase family protein [Mycolicibacterium litorale]|uniref:Polyprenyl synthetase n=1 Tax=Mycolicibacterium litorale TaxID=758802 RepID=A0AAD1IQ93_9MYCO|nr:polyprenyl synthetase family protein [Mycolicibacterium litorale]MCV7417682.1 polyprenyl synthetase family protein [Mycolicibacterium litorale]TDY06930.1 geranylgeranyl diphosphate synthase type I [Mycolicibacterium litorale]BBY18911.1 polyprenyl synthetase [Mycolicibacterium litorale]